VPIAPNTEQRPERPRALRSGPGLSLRTGSLSDVGKVRSENQDACGAFGDSDGNRVWIVADGMGGHKGGAAASRMCVETVGQHFQSSSMPVVGRLTEAVIEANRAVCAASQSDRALEGMGTTVVTLAITAEGQGWVAWVGDSRIYRWRAGQIQQITQDHSLVGEWVRQGVIQPEDAATHPRRNELMRCIGARIDVEVDAQPVEVLAGDRFLLCSDGLWGEVPEITIAEVVAQDDPQVAVARLVELANTNGGRDNVTAQIASVQDVPRPSVAAAPVRPRRREGLSSLAILGASAALVAVAIVLLWSMAG